MSAYIALFCSDVVAGIASYLPAADVLSLVGCGTRTINCILSKYVDKCLSMTARDVNVFRTYINRFQGIRFVFISGERTIGNRFPYKMPQFIERL